MALACSIGAATGLTYTTQPKHKVFIGLAILMSIFLQLQTLGLTEQGHHPPVKATPAVVTSPKPAAKPAEEKPTATPATAAAKTSATKKPEPASPATKR